MIAVVILLASAAAGTYVAKREWDAQEAEKDRLLVSQMERAVDDVIRELELCGSSRAQEIVSHWSKTPINQTEISDRYFRAVLQYVTTSFPRVKDGYTIEVANWSGGLFFMDKKTVDLVPSNATSKTELSMDGQDAVLEEPPPASGEVFGVTTVSPYYLATGNFSVNVSSPKARVVKTTSFQRPVLSALPFLESKLRSFELAADGEFSDIGKIVAYMLSTLGELRVLQGYGVPMYSGGKDTPSIITYQDVYRAIGVALLLEQARLFRTVDHEFLSEVVSACGGSTLGESALASSNGRQLDPAELFLWFLGMTDPGIDARMMVAQAVSSLADQLVVKLLDYLGWLGLLDTAGNILEEMCDTVDSVIRFFTGEDKSKTSVVAWITRTLALAGASDHSFSRLFSGSADIMVSVPGRSYFVEDASGTLYPVVIGNETVAVDLPTTDLGDSNGWSEFYPDFKASQGSMRTVLYDSITRLSFEFAASSSMDLEGLTIDPKDDLDLFSAMAQESGVLHLDLDPEAIATASRGLPMFSAQYELAQRFSSFFMSHRSSIFGHELLDAAYDGLASALLSTAKYGYIPNLAVSVEHQLSEIVRGDLESDSSWGAGAALRASEDWLLSIKTRNILSTVNSSVYCENQGLVGSAVDAVAQMIAYGSDTFPGVRSLVEEQVSRMAKSMLSQKGLSGFKPAMPTDLSGKFEFWDKASGPAQGEGLEENLTVNVVGGLPGFEEVPYQPGLGYGSLDQLVPLDKMLIQVKYPWEFDWRTEPYPNLHQTSLLNATACPYAAQWNISVAGTLDIRACSENHALSSLTGNGIVNTGRLVKLEFSLPIVLHSAWPLQGVTYAHTNTVLSDTVDAVKRFVDIIWERIEPLVRWIKNGLEKVLDFVQTVFNVLMNFATRVIKVVADVLQSVVEAIQRYLEAFAESALAKAVKIFLELTGRVEFRLSMYGFVVIVQTSIPDLLYKESNDLVRLMVYTSRFGPGMTFGIRVAKLSDGRLDVVANGTLALENAKIDVLIDPLMQVMRRLVEVHCVAKSWGFDIVIPDVEPYEIAEISTADLPGIGAFLSNIPIPVLGLSASVKAGLRMKYSPPFPSDLVVNEFEANPAGEDAGHEWVELYNPLKEPRCVDGWTLCTVHGRSSSLKLSGSVPAGGLKVFAFPEASIDNGEPGDPFRDGDSITLIDPGGNVVDVTPTLSDSANDPRTYQRSWDGGPKWVFGEPTMGGSNGPPILLASSDFITKALFEAFKQAFIDTQLSEVSASLEFITLFAKRVLNNFIENMLSIVKEVIHEVIFYIEVVFGDASGSAGIGLRASFVVTGEAIVDLLRWLIHSLATFVVNLGRASSPITYPAFPRDMFGGMFLRLEILFEVGTPKLLSAFASKTSLDTRLKCLVAISPNIPALGKLAGKDWGNWSVEFGVYLEGVPRELVSGLLKVDSGDFVDIWVVRGRLYGT